ncbi:MAG: response regulator transcription factor [Lachnospiraceae bacterium]|nr:response regulator transcription factor [Lachnospiraceae bacterium]
MRKLVRDFLSGKNMEVIEAENGTQALQRFYADNGIALVILDVMMPGADGFTVAREIRETSDVPIIFLTAKSDETDELTGFDAGADEYVTKPFSPRTLVARVEALLKRSGKTAAEQGVMSAGGIVLDKSAHSVSVEGEPVELSFKEFELLSFFMENSGIALSRDKILDRVWNYDYYGDARTIDTHVKKLRAKLKTCGDCIKTVWGMGYKFEADKDA